MFSRILPALLIVAGALSPLTLYGQRKTVLINTFDNATGDRSLDWIREGMATAIGDRLAVQPELYVFSFDERIAAMERLDIPEAASVSRATAIRIGWDMGADLLITGRISVSPAGLRIDARILDLVEESAAPDVTVNGKVQEVVPLAFSLASRLAKELVPGSTLQEPALPSDAFEAYVRGILASDAQQRMELLQDAVRLFPRYSAALYQLGQMYYLDSDYKDSTEILEKVPPGALDYPQAQFLLGMNAYHQANYGQAAQVYSALVPGYDVLVNLGAALAGAGDAVNAAAAWGRALEKKPAGLEAAFNLAVLSYRTSDWEPAASRLAQLLKAHPRDAEVMFLLGRTYDRLGRAEEASRLTAQALRLSPQLSRWAGQPAPNAIRVRTEFDATELRMPSGIWNEARLSRKLAAEKASESLASPRE